MLTPVIPSKFKLDEDKHKFVAQSPDFSNYYPVKPRVDKSLNGKITYFYNTPEDLAESAIQMEATYINGVLHGPISIWSNDGNLYCTGTYQNNKKSGEWTFYFDDGSINEKGHYDPELDKSFLKYDNLVEPFLTPSYFEYGIDTASYRELKSAGIIPLLNIGFNKKVGRTGTWRLYNQEGDVISEKQY
ncbi:MAG: hypothetical protein HUJ25_03320 [Crocinitomicaceae bacterium]|nr:hypothetical protein [Crocinitomicaceae bacterium]